MKNKKIQLTIIGFIIIESIMFFNNKNLYENRIEQHLKEYTQSLLVKRKTILNVYTMMVDNIFVQTINKPDILELQSRACLADSMQKQEIRERLHKMLQSTYDYLKTVSIRQIIFILPNNEVLLRFHRPEKYGDDLTDVRYSVKMANETKQKYIGFEEGRTYTGFRSIFPVFYDNEHVGCVEISFSFEAMNTLKQIEDVSFGFMIRKDLVEKKVSPSKKSNYVASLISDDYVHEKRFLHYTDDTLNIIKQIDKDLKLEIVDKLKANESFSTYRQIEDDYYLISFVYIENVEGKPAAYIFSYQKDIIIKDLKKQYKIRQVLSLLSLIIIGFTIVFALIKNEKAKQLILKLSTAVEQSSNTVVITDTKGNIEYVNPKFEDLTGYTLKEALGLNPRILNAGTQAKEYYIKLWKTITAGKTWKGEFHNQKKNGDYFWENVTITPIKDNAGKIKSYLAIKEDITDKKVIEIALKKSEEKYRIVAEYTYDWEYWTDINGEFIYVSPASERTTGYKPKDFYADKELMTKLIHPDDRAFFLKHKHDLDNDGERIPVEFRIITRNNEEHWIGHVCKDVYSENGELLGIRGNNRLITSQKKAENTLIESEEHLRLAQNAGKIGTWDWNVKTDEIVWSDMTYHIFGLLKTKGVMTGDEYFNYVHPDDKQRIISELDLALKNKNEEHKTEYRIIVNNELKWIDETSRIIVKSGKLVKMIGVLQDITDRKQIELEKQQKNKQLKELNATKDKFFSIIAHDLKTPFNSMLGFSKLLINNFGKYDLKKQKQFLGILNQNIQNTYKLLENLLVWSRSQRGKIDFNPENENLYLLAAQTIDILNQTAINKSIIIKNKIPENTIVKADKDMLATVLRNLLSNAIKFTSKGGMVEIGCRHVETYGRTSLQEIYVKDNGVGIPKENLAQIFNTSENVSTNGTDGETGTGLGLILCKEFVEKHGGEIWVESEIGKGSEFIFTIPV